MPFNLAALVPLLLPLVLVGCWAGNKDREYSIAANEDLVGKSLSGLIKDKGVRDEDLFTFPVRDPNDLSPAPWEYYASFYEATRGTGTSFTNQFYSVGDHLEVDKEKVQCFKKIFVEYFTTDKKRYYVDKADDFAGLMRFDGSIKICYVLNRKFLGVGSGDWRTYTVLVVSQDRIIAATYFDMLPGDVQKLMSHFPFFT